MPLDTTPLSPLRRTLAVVVMLLIFAGSLAAAQAVIALHPGSRFSAALPVKLLPALPPNFTLVQDGSDSIWLGPVAGKLRQLCTSVEPAEDSPTLASAKENGLDILREAGVVSSRESTGVLAGIPAVALVGAGRHPMAVLRTTVVDGHYVTIFLLADKQEYLGDVDLATFESICQKSQILVNGRPYQPRRAP